jgi:hypothetical protein
MVLALEEQLQKDPKADSFTMPEDASAENLEGFIAKILIQHQRDMSRLNPEYTQLRKALHEDLSKMVTPIAEAIRKGDVAPISLVHWIGEGKLIKEKGRKLATSAEVASLVGHAEKAPQAMSINITPKDYYADASFSKGDLKLALSSLEGEERTIFASMFPDAVLTQAGLSDSDVAGIRKSQIHSYEHTLAEVLAGIAAKSDKELESEGLAGNEIKQIRDAVAAIAEKGEAAIREHKTHHNNANGIERVMTNLAVSRVKGDKTYFGKVLQKGKQSLTELASKAKHAAESTKKTDAIADKEEPAAKEAVPEVKAVDSKANEQADASPKEASEAAAPAKDDKELSEKPDTQEASDNVPVEPKPAKSHAAAVRESEAKEASLEAAR